MELHRDLPVFVALALMLFFIGFVIFKSRAGDGESEPKPKDR